MTSTWLEREKTSIQCAKYSTKKSIEENQHHSSIMSTWAVLKDIAKHASILLTVTEPCSNPEFPWVQRKKTMLGNPEHFCMVQRHGRSCQEVCVERYCDLANETAEQLYEVSIPCIVDYQSKEDELKSVAKLSRVIFANVLACVDLARVGRPDILWSVNNLARPITKWTRSCDKRLARLNSYNQCTNEHKQFCHVGITAQQCQLGFILRF